MMDISVMRMKKLTGKSKEKHSVAPEKLSDTSNLILVRRLLCCQSLGSLKNNGGHCKTNEEYRVKKALKNAL